MLPEGQNAEAILYCARPPLVCSGLRPCCLGYPERFGDARLTSVNAGTARLLAADWALRSRSEFDGYIGTYLSGSAVDLPDEAILPLGTDVDLNVLITGKHQSARLRTFAFTDIPVDIGCRSWGNFSSTEGILSDVNLAGGFALGRVIDDPYQVISPLQNQVAYKFAEEPWISLRCERIYENIRRGLARAHRIAAEASASKHTAVDRMFAWLYPIALTAHLILAADLRNLTGRLRYLRAKETLVKYGQAHHYGRVLGLLTPSRVTAERASAYLDLLSEMFDCLSFGRSSTDIDMRYINLQWRPIVIDASRQAIDQGQSGEIFYYLVLMISRCKKALAARELGCRKQKWDEEFAALLMDLGLGSPAGVILRIERAVDILPTIWALTTTIREKSVAHSAVTRSQHGRQR